MGSAADPERQGSGRRAAPAGGIATSAAAAPSAATAPAAGDLRERLRRMRRRSEELIAGLEPEDLCLQGMADASPPKWHLGHTTWFFENFLLVPHLQDWDVADPRWGHLFNSYYDAVGDRHPRPQRGLLTRPAIAEVLAWRHRVDAALDELLNRLDRMPAATGASIRQLLELGLQHEQQHQELLLMDLLDGFARNPLEPAFDDGPTGPEAAYEAGWHSVAHPDAPSWRAWAGGLVAIGHGPGEGGSAAAPGGFHFDNEAPRHRVWLEPFELAERLVSNAEYEAFIADGGYRRPELWMSEGWGVVQARGWCAPRYWRGEWEFTLAGRRPQAAAAPVRHLSWFEADAYARWAGARLPGEAEWELAATADALPGAHGLLWQWTASVYRPYPGFTTAAGAVGEYNGKFMTSQFVLRGSAFLTPAGHGRHTYRNFFPPASRWMAAGLRLARGGAPAEAVRG